jgi:hypothetical protein
MAVQLFALNNLINIVTQSRYVGRLDLFKTPRSASGIVRYVRAALCRSTFGRKQLASGDVRE